MRRLAIVIALAFAALVAVAPAGAATRAVTAPTKILVIVEENHTRAQAEAGMPYLLSLQRQYGYATGMQATTHPSLPNYLMMAFGSTFGVTKDGPPSTYPISAPSVFGDALSHGGTAHVYSDGAPGNCPLKNSGTAFVVRHTAWPYAVNERTQCKANDTPLGPLAGDITAGRLPNVGWLIPSISHDAHNPSNLQDADAFLRQQVPAILAGPDFTSGRLAVVITFDEGKAANQNISMVVLHTSLSGVVVGGTITQHDLYEWQERLAGVATSGGDAGTPFGL